MIESLDKVVFFLKEHWYSKQGIVAAEIFSLILLITFFNWLGLSKLVSLTLIPFILVFLFCYWFFSIRPPKTPKNKVGFLISIASSNEDDAKKVKEDLIVPLMQLIKSGKAGKSFHFMELPQHLAEKILDPDQAEFIRVKSGAHFMLFGRVRKRQFEDGKIHHVIDFQGAVAHRPVSNQVSESLKTEFSELLPRQVQIPLENDLFSFQFTSEWADIVARYIIGIAAACSGDIFYAEQLYDDVNDRLTANQNKSFPIFVKLNERLPVRKAEIYEAMATSLHRQWVETHDLELISQMSFWLKKIDMAHQTRPAVLALRSISAFVKDADVASAIDYMRKMEHKENPVWNLNMAFLLGYAGDLKHAIQQYRIAVQLKIDTVVINQVEDFINWVIEENPEKYQLNFCLGFFNWQIRCDNMLAKTNFQKFLDLIKPNEFIKEKELAISWISQIDNSETGQPELVD